MSRGQKLMGISVWVVIGLAALWFFSSQAKPGATPTTRPTIPVAVGGLGDIATFRSYVEPLGFVGFDSPLNDGRPRWLARRTSDAAVMEAIGDPRSLTSVSVSATTDNSAGTGVLMGSFLNTYAPSGGQAFFSETLDLAKRSDQDRTTLLGDRFINVQTIRVSDGAIITVTVTVR